MLKGLFFTEIAHGRGTVNLATFAPLAALIVLICNSIEAHAYGVDISFPTHRDRVSTNYPRSHNNNTDPQHGRVKQPLQTLGDRQSFYDDFIRGCRDDLGEELGYMCDDAERVRINRNQRQPKGMLNYTKLGFKKMRAPDEVYNLLLDFWEANRERQSLEAWKDGDTFFNHWKSPSYHVNVYETNLPGGGMTLVEDLYDAAQSSIEEWTGMDLVPSSLYGIRVYKEDAVLTPHVDVNPLISSAIINIDQDVDEEWPLEVYGHDGRAYNVSMKPGDMVLYESHSVIHGRPFPLKGRYFANLFIHFEPAKDETTANSDETPYYIVRGSDFEKQWREDREGHGTIENDATKENDADSGYGVDVSFPIHQADVSVNYPWLPQNTDAKRRTAASLEVENVQLQTLGDRQSFYEEFMQGCRDDLGDELGYMCDDAERYRINRNQRQPRGMVNYTKLGFKKMRAPDEVYDLLLDFWEANREQQSLEAWNDGNTFFNHWKSPSYHVDVYETSLQGGGMTLVQKLWDAVRSSIEEWTGMDLVPSSLYGIRVYKEDAVLTPHVDVNPLISSAIINIGQDVDEEWPLEVYGHDGRAYNVSMKPGDMVLYESHSVIHGRPFPLKGRYFANLFIHFEPNKDETAADGDETPYYIVRGSDFEKQWREDREDHGTKENDADSGYGVDVSFPIHQADVSVNYPWLPHNTDANLQTLGDRQSFYEDFMQGCRDDLGNEKAYMCDEAESNRISLNQRQPRGMVNYTNVGFKKMRAPGQLYDLLSDFWETNRAEQSVEEWNDGNTFFNHWESPSFMVNVHEKALPGGGNDLVKNLWNACEDVLRNWTGIELAPSSLYGIRVYKEGAVLTPHVDINPLISSAIINIDQDVDEDWPLEVYGHNGRAYNVTMKPGDMILYESHSVIHGRPFPLKGRYFANLFIHFEPAKDEMTSDDDEIPPYILPGSDFEMQWRNHPERRRVMSYDREGDDEGSGDWEDSGDWWEDESSEDWGADFEDEWEGESGEHWGDAKPECDDKSHPAARNSKYCGTTADIVQE